MALPDLPPGDPTLSWQENPKLARRYAAAMPLWLALVEEGQLSPKNQAAFEEVLEDTLAFPLHEPGVREALLRDFMRATRFVTERNLLNFVASTLKTRDEREIALWILVDHVMNFGNGPENRVSTLLGLLLDAFNMPTRDFIRLMSESGDLDVTEHPKAPESVKVRKHCVITRENRYLEFIPLDADE